MSTRAFRIIVAGVAALTAGISVGLAALWLKVDDPGPQWWGLLLAVGAVGVALAIVSNQDMSTTAVRSLRLMAVALVTAAVVNAVTFWISTSESYELVRREILGIHLVPAAALAVLGLAFIIFTRRRYPPTRKLVTGYLVTGVLLISVALYLAASLVVLTSLAIPFASGLVLVIAGIGTWVSLSRVRHPGPA